MMAEPPASERAYQQLKVDLLKGALPVGPLDIRRLGDRLRMSATPVREALARLGAERLVQVSAYHGYAVAIPSAHRLQHLYELNGALLDLCLARLVRTEPERAAPIVSRASDYACAAAALFKEIAGSQPNLELQDRVGELGDRLQTARRHEPIVFPAAVESLLALIAVWERGDTRSVRELLRAHHTARAMRADTIARVLQERAEAS